MDVPAMNGEPHTSTLISMLRTYSPNLFLQGRSDGDSSECCYTMLCPNSTCKLGCRISDLLFAASNWDFRGAHFNTPICKLGYQTIGFGYCALQIDPVITQTPRTFFFFLLGVFLAL
mmetsp:Transcript_36154/g.86176  ORF Transcript_36154/g.86176 Transcript_36154/m.86176 type:complete len:117 (+) Transcript_36154:2045-2395(+)